MTAAHDPAPEDAELHETPPEAVFALIEADPWLQTPRWLWEPACGPGRLVEALQRAGHLVAASDLYQYEGRWCAAEGTKRHWHRDFLDPVADPLKRGVEAIVMNPPFSKADAFVLMALARVPRVYALLPLGWMQGAAGTGARDELLDNPDFWRRCHPFRERLNDMHRDGWAGNRNRTTQKHAWYVFGKAQGRDEELAQRIGIPVTRRISLRGACASEAPQATRAKGPRNG